MPSSLGVKQMFFRWKPALLLGGAVFAVGAGAFAQKPPLPDANPAPLYDAQQLPTQRGQVQQFTLTPRGDIDGLILTDGTEVKTPPHLSTEIAYSVKPGDNVTIHGLHAAALPLVQAVSITDEATGRTIVDNGSPGPGRGPAAGPAAPVTGLIEVQGRVRMALHGPRGDVNGALLEDGTVLRLPPPEAEQFAALLQPGQTLIAEGIELANPIGKVLEVRQIGASRDQLNQVQAPPGPGGKKGRRGPPPPV
jgi:hypothetical protein